MKKRQYNFFSLAPSSVILPDAKDNSRMHVFPCECGGHDHSLVVSYIDTNEEDPSYASLYLSRPIQATWRGRRWRLAYKYLTGKSIEIGMGDGTCLSTHSVNSLIEIIRSFIKFMEDNFSKEELDQVEKSNMIIRESVVYGESEVHQYKYSDITLVVDSSDDSALLIPSNRRYLFSLGLSMMEDFDYSSWEVSWTLQERVGLFRRLWWAMRYVMGRESRNSRDGVLELRYHDAIVFVSHLEKLIAVEEEFQNNTTHVSKRDFDQLTNLINNPPEPNEALKKAAQKHKDAEIKSEGLES
jgi:uncharacterized protein (DUF1778 family)